jgi:hypothetical protein
MGVNVCGYFNFTLLGYVLVVGMGGLMRLNQSHMLDAAKLRHIARRYTFGTICDA